LGCCCASSWGNVAPVVIGRCALRVDAAGWGSGVSAGSVRGLGGMLPVRCGGGGLVNAPVRWLGQAVNGKKIQDRKRQKGRDGGVQTHHDFRGRGTPEHFLH
jgi:hypothetical protein